MCSRSLLLVGLQVDVAVRSFQEGVTLESTHPNEDVKITETSLSGVDAGDSGRGKGNDMW